MAGHFLLSCAARDFTLQDVDKMSEAKVHAYFVRDRWGEDGTQICPECGCIARHYWLKTRKQWRCREIACGRFFSVTSGTKFADHKLPLKIILHAALIFCANVKGISACALARQIGVAYQTGFVLLHKLRESLAEAAEAANAQPLGGIVQIDGAHVSGRLRKPRKKVYASKTQARDRIGFAENPTHPNRRIVMVLRQLSDEPGVGAIRTVVHVVQAENEATAQALAKQYVTKGARIMTDEHPAYGTLMARYEHATVNHSAEFSTDEGVNNNQAESYFSRMRRMVIGQVHRVTPLYMHEYATEVGWREDMRRASPSLQVKTLLGLTLRSKSRYWCGYWQRKRRRHEILFVPPAGAASSAAQRAPP